MAREEHRINEIGIHALYQSKHENKLNESADVEMPRRKQSDWPIMSCLLQRAGHYRRIS